MNIIIWMRVAEIVLLFHCIPGYFLYKEWKSMKYHEENADRIKLEIASKLTVKKYNSAVVVSSVKTEQPFKWE